MNVDRKEVDTIRRPCNFLSHGQGKKEDVERRTDEHDGAEDIPS